MSFRKAFTLIELLLVVAIVVILVMLLLPHGTNRNRKAKSVECMSNLRQVGVGLQMYADSHSNRFPWQASMMDGENDLIRSDVTADYFLAATNYIQQPRRLVCPTDTSRKAATDFSNFSNSNLSYFISPDAGANNANAILTGDRHLTPDGQTMQSGFFVITNPAVVSWSKELHYTKGATQTFGVLAFSDGHVERVSAEKLPSVFQRGLTGTNRFVVP